MTQSGGSTGLGVIFRTDTNGGYYQLKYTFPFSQGKLPYGDLLEASNGKMYGMTSGGGTFGDGLIFEFDPATYTFIVRANFNNTLTGKMPMGSLIEGANGKFYGITFTGGINGSGVVFEYDTLLHTLTKKYDLNSPVTGRDTYGSLFLASNGLLYGMASQGGANLQGTLFEFDPVNDTLIVKFDFDGPNGSVPNGSLTEGNDGWLYGMTSGGGNSGYGVLFKFDPSTGAIVKLWDFDGANTGRSPYGSLAVASNGKLYGMTFTGGVNNVGCFFEWDPVATSLTKRHDFNTNNSTGGYPRGAVVEASNGLLYGLTDQGFSGTAFKFDPVTNVFTHLTALGGQNGGVDPYGSFIQASDGQLYAMSLGGGTVGLGDIFTLDPQSNVLKRKWNFSTDINGSGPTRGLVATGHGTLLGITSAGGLYDLGTLFEFDTVSNKVHVIYHFDGDTMGKSPDAPPILASDGNFYGIAPEGGLNSHGVIYKYNPLTGAVTKQLDIPFPSSSFGNLATQKLTEALDGKLYGVTEYGGPTSDGTIYAYDIVTHTCSLKASFNGTNGSQPFATMLLASNGKLYGTTNQGGQYGDGTIFEFDPATDSLHLKASFKQSTTGRYPSFETLVEVTPGHFFGTAHQGGSNNTGTLVEYDLLLDTLIRWHTFPAYANDGWYPYGLVLSPHGRLLGMNYTGGSAGKGTIFSYIPYFTYQTTTNLGLATGGFPDNELYYTGAPFITTQSTAGTYCEHTPFCIFINAAGGSVSYQWQLNGNPVTGATSASYCVPQASINDSGIYVCIAYTATDTLYSDPIAIQVLPSPVVTIIASDTSICSGDSISLSATGAQTYSWNPAIQPNVNFVPASTTTYAVTGTNSNGCMASTNITITVSSCVGITETGQMNDAMTVIPNPGDGHFVIRHSLSGEPEIMVFNATGQEIFHAKTNSSTETEIDLGNQPSGIYLVRICSGEKTISGKLIRL